MVYANDCDLYFDDFLFCHIYRYKTYTALYQLLVNKYPTDQLKALYQLLVNKYPTDQLKVQVVCTCKKKFGITSLNTL